MAQALTAEELITSMNLFQGGGGSGAGFGNFTVPPQQYTQPLPPAQWPDNTLIRDMLVRMDKELAETLRLLLKRLDKIDDVVGRIEQAGRYSS